MAMIEVGKTSRARRTVLIVHAREEGDTGGRDVVDRLRPRVRALEVQSFREVVRNGRLQTVVVGIRVRIERLKRLRINPQVRRPRLEIASTRRSRVGRDLS